MKAVAATLFFGFLFVEIHFYSKSFQHIGLSPLFEAVFTPMLS